MREFVDGRLGLVDSPPLESSLSLESMHLPSGQVRVTPPFRQAAGPSFESRFTGHRRDYAGRDPVVSGSCTVSAVYADVKLVKTGGMLRELRRESRRE